MTVPKFLALWQVAKTARAQTRGEGQCNVDRRMTRKANVDLAWRGLVTRLTQARPTCRLRCLVCNDISRKRYSFLTHVVTKHTVGRRQNLPDVTIE